MISETELTWQTCFQAYDAEQQIELVVAPDDGNWRWHALADDGSLIGGVSGFSSALDAQQAAVEWWREQKG